MKIEMLCGRGRYTLWKIQ